MQMARKVNNNAAAAMSSRRARRAPRAHSRAVRPSAEEAKTRPRSSREGGRSTDQIRISAVRGRSLRSNRSRGRTCGRGVLGMASRASAVSHSPQSRGRARGRGRSGDPSSAPAVSTARSGIPAGRKPSDYCKNAACRDKDGLYRRRKQSGYGRYCATCCTAFDPWAAEVAKAKKTHGTKLKAKDSSGWPNAVPAKKRRLTKGPD